MKKIIIVCIIVAWVVCGVINWGATLGDFTHRFPHHDDGGSRNFYGFASFMAISGCVGFPAVLFMSNFYQNGFLWN